MPPKKAAPLAAHPAITKHFAPAAAPSKKKNIIATPPIAPVHDRRTTTAAPPPPPRLLVDRDTEVAYAEVVDGVAVCLETGVELFEVHRGDAAATDGIAPRYGARRFDFSPPPTIGPHPKWRDIRSQDLLDAGVLTEDDFMHGTAGLTVAQYEAWWGSS
jgi:hypothetical protein